MQIPSTLNADIFPWNSPAQTDYCGVCTYIGTFAKLLLLTID